MIVAVTGPRRWVGVASFADITTKECLGTGWDDDGRMTVQFAVNLTVDEARLVRVRCLTFDAAAETLLRGAVTAYTTNADYLALPAPTTAQALQQVSTLTREVQLLLRALAPID